MPKRIKEDHKRFRDVVSGRTRQELKRLMKTGAIVRSRPKGGKLTISIPEIEIPHFVFGRGSDGVGRGPGKGGDIVGRDPQPGQGKGKASDEAGEGILVQVDMEDVLKFMEEELKLPAMQPKPNETYEDIKIKYNDISKVGPQSLRHTRRTMKEGLKRLASQGKINELHYLSGSHVPMRQITLSNSDRRYRQYREIRIPSSNAVIFFARDCSGSMDDTKCEIVSDMSWWIDCWIRRFYEKVDRCYFVHDTQAKEVDEHTFYTYRFGGGTMCSSAFSAIADQLKNRYPPASYNIYVFYFTDGENWEDDNDRMIKVMREDLQPHVNLIGVTQVLAYYHNSDVKSVLDKSLKDRQLNREIIKLTSIGETPGTGSASMYGGFNLSEEDRNNQILNAIKDLLGTGKVSS